VVGGVVVDDQNVRAAASIRRSAGGFALLPWGHQREADRRAGPPIATAVTSPPRSRMIRWARAMPTPGAQLGAGPRVGRAERRGGCGPDEVTGQGDRRWSVSLVQLVLFLLACWLA